MAKAVKPKKPRIGVIGLGYVGLPLAVEFGKRFETVGFDISAARVADLKRGRDSTLEVSKGRTSRGNEPHFHDPRQRPKALQFLSS